MTIGGFFQNNFKTADIKLFHFLNLINVNIKKWIITFFNWGTELKFKYLKAIEKLCLMPWRVGLGTCITLLDLKYKVKIIGGGKDGKHPYPLIGKDPHPYIY